MPNWVENGRPPANGLPPSVVWQAWQSAASVRYLPRAQLIGVREVGGHARRMSGGVLGE